MAAALAVLAAALTGCARRVVTVEAPRVEVVHDTVRAWRATHDTVWVRERVTLGATGDTARTDRVVWRARVERDTVRVVTERRDTVTVAVAAPAGGSTGGRRGPFVAGLLAAAALALGVNKLRKMTPR